MNAGVSLDRQPDHPYAISRWRRSALLFVAGKGLTAPLNLVTFFLIAARLPTELRSVTAGAIVTVAAFLIALRVLRPFAPAERRAMETLLGRKLVLP